MSQHMSFFSQKLLILIIIFSLYPVLSFGETFEDFCQKIQNGSVKIRAVSPDNPLLLVTVETASHNSKKVRIQLRDHVFEFSPDSPKNWKESLKQRLENMSLELIEQKPKCYDPATSVSESLERLKEPVNQIVSLQGPTRQPPESKTAREREYYSFLGSGTEKLKNPLPTMDSGQFLEAIKTLDGLRELFKDTETIARTVRHSLYEFKRGMITESQLATLNYFASGGNETFDLSKKDIKAFNYKDPNLQPYLAEFFGFNSKEYHVAEPLKEFLSEMDKTDSPLEKTALLIPIPTLDPRHSGNTLDYEISTATLRFFKPVVIGGKPYTIVPSDTMFQVALRLYSIGKEKSGSHIVVHHQFGMQSADFIARKAAVQSWPVHLHHPDEKEHMYRADGHFARDWTITKHDWYHIFRSAQRPVEDEAALARIRSVVERFMKSHGMPPYQETTDPKKYRYKRILDQLTDRELYDVRKGQLFGSIFNKEFKAGKMRLVDWPSDLLIEVLADMANNSDHSKSAMDEKTEWEEYLGMGQKDLFPFEQVLYRLVKNGPEGKELAILLRDIDDAIDSNSLDKLKALLSEGENRNNLLKLRKLGGISFINLVMQEHKDEAAINSIIDQFTEKDISSDLDTHDSTPLMYAARYKLGTTVQKLIQKGFNVRGTDSNIMSAFSYAAASGCKTCLKAIYDSKEFEKAGINGAYGSNYETPLHLAILGNNGNDALETVRYLLELHVDPTKVNIEGEDPLAYAMKRKKQLGEENQQKIIKLLNSQNLQPLLKN